MYLGTQTLVQQVVRDGSAGGQCKIMKIHFLTVLKAGLAVKVWAVWFLLRLSPYLLMTASLLCPRTWSSSVHAHLRVSVLMS